MARKLIHDPPVSKVKDVKVDEQAHRSVAHSDVGERNCFMNGLKGGDRFQLNEYRVLNQEIDSVANVYLHAPVHDGDWELGLTFKPIWSSS